MKIGLIDVDSKIANLALMKISKYHKMKGDIVEWYNIFEHYDIVYMSKVFTFTPDYQQIIANADIIIKGGTGYDLNAKLDDDIDALQPDYSIYDGTRKQIPHNVAMGFITRGCPNSCSWCVVPKKEGKTYAYNDVEDISEGGRRNHLILLDNNVLSSDYGIEQMKKIADKGYIIDFNQGIDARLVTLDIADIMSRIKWERYIRMGCDTPKQVDECERASQMLINRGYNKFFFYYCILGGKHYDNAKTQSQKKEIFLENFNRANHWKQRNNQLIGGGYSKRFFPHCQPYRDFNNPHQVIPQWQKDMAGWADKRWVFSSCEFVDFEPRKGFKCGSYFDNINLL